MNCHKTFSESYSTLDVIAENIFSQTFNHFVTTSENVRAGKNLTDFSQIFWLLWPGFWSFHKSFTQYKSYTRRCSHAKFVANWSRDGWALAGEKNKNKSREKLKLAYYREFFKNCTFAKRQYIETCFREVSCKYFHNFFYNLPAKCTELVKFQLFYLFTR